MSQPSFNEYKAALQAKLATAKSDLGIAILVGLGMWSAGETDDRIAATFLNLSIREMGILQEMVVEEALSFFQLRPTDEILTEDQLQRARFNLPPAVPDPILRRLPSDERPCPQCGGPNPTTLPICIVCLLEGDGG